MSAEASIKQFIVESLMAGSGRDTIEPDEQLVNSKIIDSLGMMRLITFLEEHFEIEVDDGDVGNENFGTLQTLVNYVEGKQVSK